MMMDRPEVRVLGNIDPVKLQTGSVGIGLQVERRQLYLPLFVVGKPGERGGKAVGKDRRHLTRAYLFLRSIASWLY
ncbi:hypothetical protein D9M72_395840 [compost metagenome]